MFVLQAFVLLLTCHATAAQSSADWQVHRSVQDGGSLPAQRPSGATRDPRDASHTRRIADTAAHPLHHRHQGQSAQAARQSGAVAPWNINWNNSIGLCVSMSQENATDVREWLAYYRWIGVDHVYLTENVAAGEPLRAALSDFIDAGFLTYAVQRAPHAQMRTVAACVARHRGRHNWLALFDADEYLVVRERGKSLKRLLDEFRFFPGLAVHWVTVGPGGRDTRPDAGGVLRHYTRCNPTANANIKIIANTYFIDRAVEHPHNVAFRGDASPVNERRLPVPMLYVGTPSQCAEPGRHPAACALTAGSRLSRRRGAVPTVERVALFHYITRSRADFAVKAARGGGASGRPKTWPFFDGVARSANSTESICREPSQVADACCPEAHYVSQAAAR